MGAGTEVLRRGCLLTRMERPEHKAPDWEMGVETELVRRNLEECMRGGHEPRPMVPAIHPSSTFLLQDSKEGEVLSGNKAKVLHQCMMSFAGGLVTLRPILRFSTTHVLY